MKNTFFILIAIVSLLACNFSRENGTVSFIPGTYIRYSQHEYGTEHDTLFITLQNESPKQYVITRRWKYEQVLNGQALEPKYERRITTALYDNEKGLLQESETGKTYAFNPSQNSLHAGKNSYQKIN